jgi:hypothetical protein
LDSNSLWKHYQIKNVSNQINVPAYVILSPNNYDSSLNNINFSDVGVSVSKDSDAFKKIQKFSKVTNNNITRDTLSNLNNLKKINNLYTNNNLLNSTSYNYGNSGQQSKSSLNSTLPYSTTLLDQGSLKKYFSYSLGSAAADKTNSQVFTNFNEVYPNSDSDLATVASVSPNFLSSNNKNITSVNTSHSS